MKTCKLCGSTYADKVDFCFRDGQPLVRGEEPAPAPAPARGGLRPGLADMLDVPEPGFARPVDPTALPDRTGTPLPGELDGEDDDLRAILGSGEGAADLPERPILLERDPSTAEALVDVAETPLPPPADDEDLAPPAPLSLSGLAAGAELEAPSAAGHGLTMVPDDERPVPSAPDVASADDDLPPPRPLDDDRDPEALADLARTLGGQDASSVESEVTEHDPVELDPPAVAPGPGSSPGLDDLVEQGDGRDGQALFIGADGAAMGSLDTDAPPPANNNKLIFGLFGAAALVGVVGLAVIGMSGGQDEPDPMASLPEERAAPVVTAPAAPEPAPALAAPEVPVDPVAVDPLATEAVAAVPAAPAPPAPGTPVAAPLPTPAATPAAATTARTPPPTPTAVASSVAVPPPAVSQPTADLAGSDPWNTRGAATSGRLTINSIPSGATVYVDNRQVGRSPLSTDLGYGMHTIRVELGGYSSEQRTIDVQVPEMAVPFELKPTVVTGTVNIFGPTGATVLVDGAQVGKIPTSVKLTEGSHAFEVRTTDGSSFSRSQDVRFDGGTTVSVTLSP
ncbi:PEGA domain-containing protein [Myxococcota bacterium]|nr:PEGA domain-containing protein [Myxococcota bacterium]